MASPTVPRRAKTSHHHTASSVEMTAIVSRRVQPGSALGLFSKYYRVAGLFLALAAVYLVVILFMPFESSLISRYHVLPAQTMPLALAIYLPYVCIWFVALVAYLRLRDYVQQILPSQDGRAFRHISRGVFLMTLWLPISAVLSASMNYYRQLPQYVPTVTRITDYANVLVALVAYGLIYWGSRKLLAMIQQPEPASLYGVIFFVVFAAIYTYLVFHEPATSTARASSAPYYLPEWLVLTTIVVPRLVEWIIGIKAAYNLYAYRASVTGKIYREALTSLSVGLVGVVILSGMYRSFQTLVPRLHNTSLASVLLVAYGLLAVLSLGYMFVARGASRLHRIEKT